MQLQPLIALVDCNNFYVSCERVFRPDLINNPVAVLSNNDGCVVARSQEVKDLGVKMGIPVFQIQQLIYQHQIQLFSSNYTLYADMSARVMTTLEEFAPSLEIYSIDEAFLDLTGVYRCSKDTIAYGQAIRKTVFRRTGIPVCVGMGPTKTLAKLANFAAKKWKKTGGVLDLSDINRRNQLMKIVPVNEVWGIGRKTAVKLNALGIYTAWDLANQPKQYIQLQFNVVIARIIMELNGIACLKIDEIAPDKQQIVCSRSFGHKLTEYQALMSAVAEFCSRAGEKLRQQNSVTAYLTVFIRTNPFNHNEPQYHRAASIKLPKATQDTRILIATANQLLSEIYKEGFGYQKCGVQLSAIQTATSFDQADLFEEGPSDLFSEKRALMATIDQINGRFKKGISIAVTNIDKSWQPKAERKSPHYTTNWDELVCVHCH